MFLRFAMVRQGAQRLLENETLKMVVSLLSASDKAEDHALVLQAIRVVYLNAIFPSNSNSISSSSLFPPSMPTRLPDSLIKASLCDITLPSLTTLFKSNQDQLKFDLLDVFIELIDVVPAEIWKSLQKSDPQHVYVWLANLRTGLRHILTSKLAAVQRNKALILTSTLLRQLGPAWLFPPYPFPSKAAFEADPRDAQEDTRFPALVVRLACIEIKLLMDSWGERRARELRVALERTVDENKGQGASAGEEVEIQERTRREEEMIPACYVIVEATVQVLVVEGESVFDPLMLTDVREALMDSLRGVMEVLADLKDSIVDFKDVLNDMVMLASIRVLAAWFSEDNSFTVEAADLMPLFVSVCRESRLTLDQPAASPR